MCYTDSIPYIGENYNRRPSGRRQIRCQVLQIDTSPPQERLPAKIIHLLRPSGRRQIRDDGLSQALHFFRAGHLLYFSLIRRPSGRRQFRCQVLQIDTSPPQERLPTKIIHLLRPSGRRQFRCQVLQIDTSPPQERLPAKLYTYYAKAGAGKYAMTIHYKPHFCPAQIFMIYSSFHL